ncbi:hypothetical protein QVD17_39773 [Tagetes erecta]|uniref:Replication factor A C-terminal domain-containing protein n=1 Tax=Tagetes erecta TaxID=13708 RepID=A0AAD8NFM5_TARER|nr:hypothetical protein QVD17_39773 [Tagetes erecta]
MTKGGCRASVVVVIGGRFFVFFSLKTEVVCLHMPPRRKRGRDVLDVSGCGGSCDVALDAAFEVCRTTAHQSSYRSAMYSNMEGDEIASLHTYAAAIPLNVRALRKWKPAGRSNETCFLLIDKQGVAVQAVVTGSEQRHVKTRLSMGSCYRIENYECNKVDPYTNIVTHSTHLSIGMSTSFAPIPDTNEIPTTYFDFASKDRILKACDRDDQVIATITTDEVKLQSSAATYVYLNPLTVQSSQLLELYQSGRQADAPAYQRSVENAKATIKELTLKPGKQINAHTFIITGHIAHIPHQAWCRIACEECNKDVIEAGPKCYRVNRVIRDETGTMNATIYDEVIADLMGFKCSEIAEGNDILELNRSTAPLKPIIGRQTNFQVIQAKNDRSGAIRCTIHRCLPIQIEHNHPLAAITTNAPITPQQTANATKQVSHSLAKRQLMLDVAGDNPKVQKADNKGKNVASNPVEAETQLAKKPTNNKTHMVSVQEAFATIHNISKTTGTATHNHNKTMPAEKAENEDTTATTHNISKTAAQQLEAEPNRELPAESL